MAEITEFHSVWPVISGRILKKRNSNFKICQNVVLDDTEKDITLFREDLAFNTNAKTTPGSPDRLKKIFADRQSHRNLAEQKVSDWLIKYRSYTHIPPKDMTDVPDNIWAPLDIDRSSKNNAASDLSLGKHQRDVTELRVRRRILKSNKGKPSKSPSKYQPLSIIRINTADGKGQQPYFFNPPYKKVDSAFQTMEDTNKPIALRRIESYMNVSRGLLKGSRLVS